MTFVNFFHRPQGQSSGNKRPNRGDEANNPWASFMRMSFDLSLEYHDFYHRFGDDGARFLTDTVDLALQTYSSGDTKYALEQALIDFLRYTVHLKSRDARDKIRRLFCLLFFFDLACLVGAGPSGQIGCLQEGALMKFVRKDVLMNMCPELPMDRMSKWSLQGGKLNILCERFGTGCLFFLAEHLTGNL